MNSRSFLEYLILFFLVCIGFDYWIASLINPYLFSIIIYAGINIILATSLNLVNGFTGQFSMGHAGFMSIGAYTSALLTLSLRHWSADIWLLQKVIFFISLIAGGCFAALAGYCVGLPSLRLKGDYLAIVTLGFGEIIRVVIFNLSIVGGARGLGNIPGYTTAGWVYAIAGFTLVFLWRTLHSPLGRKFLAVREDEIAASAMGVDVTKAKVKAFMIGGFFAGVAGGLFSHFLRYLNAQSFDFNRSFEIIIMVVLGGMGSLSGSVLSAVLLTSLKEILRPLQDWTHIDFRMIIFALLMIILMLLRPAGICGTKEIWNMRK